MGKGGFIFLSVRFDADISLEDNSHLQDVSIKTYSNGAPKDFSFPLFFWLERFFFYSLFLFLFLINALGITFSWSIDI